MRRLPLALALFAAPVIAAGCHKKQAPPAPAPTPTVNQDSIDKARAAADSAARADAARRDSLARAQAQADSIRNAREQALAQQQAALTAQVFFDYDSDALTDASRSTLDAKIPILNANSGVRIRIEGNTDERGSDEYNLALGQRRAAAAKRYLTDHGVDGSRIDVVSYGEERSTCQTEDESCWSQNRRDEFVMTAGSIAPPM